MTRTRSNSCRDFCAASITNEKTSRSENQVDEGTPRPLVQNFGKQQHNFKRVRSLRPRRKNVHTWCEQNPAFAAATREARAKAKIKLVNIIRNAARKNAHFACWLLERSWRDEYARTERIETQPAEQKENSLRIFYDTQGASLSELLTFPIDPSMHTDSEGEAATEEVHYAPEEAEAPPEAHDAPPQVDAPPPSQVVFKPLTGRIRPEWKNPNGS